MVEMARERKATPATSDDRRMSRRDFLSYVALSAGGLVTAVLSVPVVGFLFWPLLRRELDVWRPIGAVEDFEIGQTVAVTFLDAAPVSWAGVAAETAAWVRRVSDTHFVAFSVKCTHIGCLVRWQNEADLFLCPCHGGVFNREGEPVAGPVNRPLDVYPVRVRGGQVEIRADQ
jgi:menaquinol-cytochrome c reductase iron-sulfur subunit